MSRYPLPVAAPTSTTPRRFIPAHPKLFRRLFKVRKRFCEPSFVETRLPLPKRKASTPEHPQLLVLLDEPQRKRASRYCNRDAPRCYGFGASPRSRTSRREIGRASCRERVWNGEVGVVWKN